MRYLEEVKARLNLNERLKECVKCHGKGFQMRKIKDLRLPVTCNACRGVGYYFNRKDN